MATTYQLTADSMISKSGKDEALKLATKLSANGDKFWQYVAQCIRQAA